MLINSRSLFYFSLANVFPGRQLTIFNTQAVISVGGSDRSRPFQGQLSGLYYNGLRVLHMAVESNQNVRVNGSVRLVGDVPSVVGAARSTGMPPEMSATLTETTTMMSTTTTRKHRSSSTVQVATSPQNRETFRARCSCGRHELRHLVSRCDGFPLFDLSCFCPTARPITA